MDYHEALKQAVAEAKKQPNINNGQNEYNDIKHKAAIAEQYERQKLAERISAAGGSNVPLTIQSRDDMANKAIQGAITNTEKNYTQYLNDLTAQANANAEAQSAGFTADFNAAQNASVMNQNMNDLDRYYALYMNGKMTSSQFKKKTGLDVHTYKDQSEPKTDEQKFIDNINQFVDAGILTQEQGAAIARQGDFYTDEFDKAEILWRKQNGV